MFRVKNMSTEDFGFATAITDEMGWGMAKGDFQFMMELEPKGCFVLLEDSESVGIATTVSFGNAGWFGNLVVSETHRKKGGGSLLVKHSLRYLKEKSVETVGLYAYIDKVPFYRKLGFKYDSEFAVLKGKGFSSKARANLKEAGNEDILEVIDLDRYCFGASRRKLLQPILLDRDNLCCTWVTDGQTLGYSVAKVYAGMAELGPLVCRPGHSDIAVDLLKATLNRLAGLEVSVCVPRKESPILNMLEKGGFRESFRVARMFSGPPIAGDCVYVAESLERG